MQELTTQLELACQKLFDVDIQVELTRPEEKFGDYATNVALQLAKQLGKNPREVAEQLAVMLKDEPTLAAKPSIAGPGFINLKLTDKALAVAAFSATKLPKPLIGQEIVLEHTDPNPFKEFHIGHAYSNTVGVAIGKLLQEAGAQVHQVTYQGDVGLHIAMAIFSLQKSPDTELGQAYAAGTLAYKNDPQAKAEIEKINQRIYERNDPKINQLYGEGRQRSLKAFEGIYQKLDVQFEKNYFESDTAQEGMKIVKDNTGRIFKESAGAIIYDGEKVGLHTRVFITKQDLPTYEAKEIGLAFAKERDYPDAKSFVVITANEIDDYFNVLVAAIKEVDAKLAAKIRHLSHGVVRLGEGKMSSRSGNVKTLDSLESDLAAKTSELYGEDRATSDIVLGAMKYEFLKHRLGSDFIFDVGESVSLEGNSGPYLQYAHARACSILQKAKSNKQQATSSIELEAEERSLARKISEYPEVVARATADLMPHHICTYLYELAQVFNRFYEKNRVLDDPRQDTRLELVKAYSDVLKHGLELLNIAAPEHI